MTSYHFSLVNNSSGFQYFVTGNFYDIGASRLAQKCLLIPQRLNLIVFATEAEHELSLALMVSLGICIFGLWLIPVVHWHPWLFNIAQHLDLLSSVLLTISSQQDFGRSCRIFGPLRWLHRWRWRIYLLAPMPFTHIWCWSLRCTWTKCLYACLCATWRLATRSWS